MDCPRSTTGRSSTPSATRCERSNGRTVASAPVDAGPTISFAFNLGKIPDQGEDSDPIVRDGPDLGLVAVFDGMGGAGGTVYETPDGRRTGAYLASRVARDVVERRMLELLEPDWNLNGKAAAQDLQRSVRPALRSGSELKAPASGLRSRLLRALPTTMALVALQRPNRAGRPGPVTCSGPVTRGRTSSSRPGRASSAPTTSGTPGTRWPTCATTRWSATRCRPTPTSTSTTARSSCGRPSWWCAPRCRDATWPATPGGRKVPIT